LSIRCITLLKLVSVCLISLLVATPNSVAGETRTIPLSDYIDLANRSGLNVLYSSDLLRSRYQVTHDEAVIPTLESLKKALTAFDLSLEIIQPNTYTIVRAALPKLPESRPLPLKLDLATLPLEEVIVSSSRYRLYTDTGSASQTFDAETLSERAVTANDAARIVNHLPGSASVGISARPRVRGGNEDETLIHYDGVQLYNPFHFNRYNSLFSTFDNRLLGSIDFYSGGFPAPLGDRLSAAMLISTKTNRELINQRELGVGLYNLSYMQSFDLGDQSLLFNVRRSNFELIDQLAENDVGNPSFGDLFTRYSRDLKSGAVWDVSLLWFGDDIEINNSAKTELAENHTSNTYLWTRLSEDLSSTLNRTTIAGLAQILDDREGTLNKPNQVRGSIKDDQTFRFYFAKQDYERLSEFGLFAFGWDYRYLDADYEYGSDQIVEAAFSQLSHVPRSVIESSDVNETGHQGAVYLSWKQRFLDTLTAELGVRIDAQHYEHTLKNEQVNYRVGVLYQPTKALNLRVGWGRYSQAQGIHELNISDLEDDFQPAQSADHLIVGMDYAFAKPGINVRLEAYQKDADKTRPYFQNLANPYTLIPELQVDRVVVIAQRYKAEGIELSLDGNLFDGDWWLNYSYSSVKDELLGKDIHRSWDQARSANVGYHRTFGAWQLSTSATFHEGWLTTPLSFDGTIVRAGQRNSERFDHFLSVDIKAKRTWQLGRGDLRLEAGITNALDRENQIGVNFSLENGALATTPENGLPLAPFLDFYWAF